MDHTQIHAVVELVDKGGNAASNADVAVNLAARGIAASQAFRKYDWLRKAPLWNASGNFRGMVVNGNARIAYDFTVNYGTKIEKVNSYAAIVVALADSAEQIYKILQSNDTLAQKGAKLGPQATAIAMNVLTGVVTTPVHLVLMSMQGYCDISDVIRGNQIGTCGGTLKAIDVIVESSAKQVSDGNNIYNFVNTTINPRVSKALGL